MKISRFLSVAVLAVPGLCITDLSGQVALASSGRFIQSSSPAQMKVRRAALEVVVTTASDTVNPEDGVISLREAIATANFSTGTTIRFAIPGAGSRTIAPLTALPSIVADGTVIDGFTQAGSVNTQEPNTSTRNIIITGASAPAGTSGITVAANAVVLKGLNLTGFKSHGVLVDAGSGIQLSNNFWIRNGGDGLRIRPGADVAATGLWQENGGLGINYAVPGEGGGVPTPNDALDADNIPNFPVVSRISYDAATGQAVIEGTLSAKPGASYAIDAFVNPTGDPSGYGEGSIYIGRTGFGTSTAVVTNASGTANWTVRGPYLGGGSFAALATRTIVEGGPTYVSEFSRGVSFSTPRPLSLTGAPATLREGGPAVTVTAGRETSEATPLTLNVFLSPVGQITAPATVTIPAGQRTVQFSVSATDDLLADGNIGTILAVTAPDRTPAGVLVDVQDNDPATVLLLPGTATVTEGGAPLSLRLLRNTAPPAGPLSVSLSATPASQLNFPPTVVIPDGANEVSFSVSAVDDATLDGDVTVTLTPSTAGYASLPARITARDNEVPGIQLALPDVATEGSSLVLTGTLSRQGVPLTAPLTATFSVSPTSQLNLPVSVQIPAGQSSVTFNFSVVDDVIHEANPRPVTVTAATPGFTSAQQVVALFDNDAAGNPLQAWGYNALGQAGLGNNTNRSIPAQVALPRVVTMAANGSHSLAVQDDGTVRAWGYNGGGQVGDGTLTDRNAPVAVAGLTNVRAVAAGWYHSLALLGDGTVYAWGYNQTGQLGDGTLVTRRTPVRVPGLIDIVAISAGAHFSLALQADGTVYAWGNNLYGQLGDNTNTSRLRPNRVPGISGIAAISAGAGHSLFLTRSGSLLATGWNAYAQLGDGTLVDRRGPVRVTAVGSGTAISAGYAHSLVLQPGGLVRGFGDNSYGQGGNSESGVLDLPLAATGISAGSNFSVAYLQDGSVFVTGSNSWGQLGQGTLGGRTSSPGQVFAIDRVSAAVAGYGHALAIARNSPAGSVVPGAKLPSQYSF